MKLGKYFAKEVEAKWQQIWNKSKAYSFKKDANRKKYYNLVELPYPSGDLHLGHWFAFVPPDVHARYKKMSGLNVFFPNWCPTDQTVLANEHIEAGKCWRCGSEVIQKEVEQWFLAITKYADSLIWKDQPQADWPKQVVEGQNNWIGKSEGMLIDFPTNEKVNYVLLHGFTGS